jgi:hypothetical protein
LTQRAIAFARRHRDHPFKLVRPYVTRGIKLSDSSLPMVLYDLDNDPAESRDVADGTVKEEKITVGETKQLSLTESND